MHSIETVHRHSLERRQLSGFCDVQSQLDYEILGLLVLLCLIQQSGSVQLDNLVHMRILRTYAYQSLLDPKEVWKKMGHIYDLADISSLMFSSISSSIEAYEKCG
jgi:hypothetical protein